MTTERPKLFAQPAVQQLLGKNVPFFPVQERIARTSNQNVYADVEFVFQSDDEKGGDGKSSQEPLYGHKVILCSASEVLRAMIQDCEEVHKKEGKKGRLVIPVPRYPRDAFVEMLRYVSGDVLTALRNDHVESILALAGALALPGLAKRAMESLKDKLTPATCVESYRIAKAHGAPTDTIVQYVMQNFMDAVDAGGLEVLEPSEVISILQSDELEVKEAALFNTVRSAVRQSVQRRREALKRSEAKGDEAAKKELAKTEGMIEKDIIADQLREALKPYMPYIRFSLFSIDEFHKEVAVPRLLPLSDVVQYYAMITTPMIERDKDSPYYHKSRALPLPFKHSTIATALANDRVARALLTNFAFTDDTEFHRTFQLEYRLSTNTSNLSQFNSAFCRSQCFLVLFMCTQGNIWAMLSQNQQFINNSNTYHANPLRFLCVKGPNASTVFKNMGSQDRTDVSNNSTRICNGVMSFTSTLTAASACTFGHSMLYLEEGTRKNITNTTFTGNSTAQLKEIELFTFTRTS